MKEQIENVTEIERMAYEMERFFIEAEIKQTLPKKHPSIVKAEALYNAGYRKQSEGEWKIMKIGDGERVRTCSNCIISQSVNVYKGKVMFRYCPYCGAKMKGGAE